VLAISNHGFMLGGGEYSFYDLMTHMPAAFKPICALPGDAELADRLRAKEIDVKVISLPAIRPWLIPAIIDSIRSLADACRKIKPNLIYANGSRAAFYGGLVGRILRIPVVWHCRIATADPILDLMLVKLVSQIVVNSKATAKRFHPKHRQKIAVVYNGIDIQWFKDSNLQRPDFIREDWKVILVVSRISRWKRHDLVLSAFEDLARLNPKIHLVCVGAKDSAEPDWWSRLHERTHRSSFSKRIHWIGQVDDVRPWYRAASVLLLASDNEPFGRVLVEAMTCGVPVIATRSGGVPEIVRDGIEGILVSKGEEIELAEAMSRVLKDDALNRKLAIAGRKRASLFDLEVHVKNMVKVFEQLAGN